MSPLVYTLNSAAWSLVGVIMTLTYQRVMNWWRGRKRAGQLPPISTAAYFGSLLLLFAIIATLFSYSGKVAAENNKKCPDKQNALLSDLRDHVILPLSVCTDNKVPPNISPSDIVSTHSN
jgi:hypothetical protein